MAPTAESAEAISQTPHYQAGWQADQQQPFQVRAAADSDRDRDITREPPTLQHPIGIRKSPRSIGAGRRAAFGRGRTGTDGLGWAGLDSA